MYKTQKLVQNTSIKGASYLINYFGRLMRFIQYGRNKQVLAKYVKIKQVLSTSLSENLTTFREIMGSSYDIKMREFVIGNSEQTKGAVVYIEVLTDREAINQNIIKPLIYDVHLYDLQPDRIEMRQIQNMIISESISGITSDFDELVEACLYGNVLLLVDGCQEAMMIEAQGWESRGIEQPETEIVIRGPREAFTEVLNQNISLIRRKVNNPNLRLQIHKIGRQTKTRVCTVYIEGIVNPKLINEVNSRLKGIDTDAILESGYIEQFIEDESISPFPTISHSEKPDIIVAKILEGRIAIVVDGTPFVLALPMFFVEVFQTAEDYYIRPFYATFLRIIRVMAFFLSTLSPALYVALSTYNQELIPTSLIITMAGAKQGTPFPAVIDVLIMVITFEIIREAGVRLPRAVGQAISIVGALVIGEEAVSAGLVGAPVVIVIAITAISSFVIPAQINIIILLRFIYITLAGLFGFFGIMLGLVGMIIHLAGLRSFGIPYLAPFAPLEPQGLKDSIVRLPFWGIFFRPPFLGKINRQRRAPQQKPQPDQQNN